MTEEQDNSSGLLQGRSEICTYLRISRVTFVNFVRWGMPARFQNGRWYAHRKNIDEFIRKWTYIVSPKQATVEELSEDDTP